MTPRPGWHSSVFALVCVVVVLAVLAVAVLHDPLIRRGACAVIPTAVIWYGSHRKQLHAIYAAACPVDLTANKIAGDVSPVYSIFRRLSPRVYARLFGATNMAETIIETAATTVENFIDPAVKKVVESACAKVGITDPATLANFQSAADSFLKGLIGAAEPLAAKLVNGLLAKLSPAAK